MTVEPLGFGPYTTLELVAGAFALGSTALGLFISYLAYRGLRRHRSTRMRYLAVGMMLLFGVSYAVALLGQTFVSIGYLPLAHQNGFRVVVRVLQFAGLACITYSLVVGAQSDDAATPPAD